jgi:hypothetical protein
MTRVVISQPFFFPWVGLFEQIRLSDVYAHADDVAYTKGGFINRVQIKTAAGIAWLSVPVKHPCAGLPIATVAIDDTDNWRKKHLGQLETAYARAPFRDDMLALVRSVYEQPVRTIYELDRASIAAACEYLGVADPAVFRETSQIPVGVASTDRVIALVQALHGDVYITGHGARRYLDHERVEAAGIRVEYIAYRRTAYPQLHGAFDPHVSILDLIANAGRDGASSIHSGTTYWRDFLRAQPEPESGR